MSGNSIRDTFFEECEELLEALVEGLASMEESPDDMEIINAVFRAVHSIKGGAGAFGLERLVSFAHAFETVLDKVRDKELGIDEKLMSVAHRSGDQLSDLVASARDDSPLDEAAEDELKKELESYLGGSADAEEFSFDALTLDFGGGGATAAVEEAEATGQRVFSIRFKPMKALYENGHEPLLIFDALAEFGTLSVTADLSGLPAFDAFDPNDAVISWTLTLTTGESETTLHEVFEFVEGLCELDVSVEEGAAPRSWWPPHRQPPPPL